MNANEILRWWQNLYPQWASVNAPLVRYRVHETIQCEPLETVLRLAFVRCIWRDEPIRMSNALNRLSNIYDCSAQTVIADLKRVGIDPLASFVERYPTQMQMSQATFQLFVAPSEEIIQEASEFDALLANYCESHQAEILDAVERVNEASKHVVAADASKLNAKKQDELCFQWAYYLAIADALEPERRKLVERVKPDQELHKMVAEKCNHFVSGLTELLDHARKQKPPHALAVWIEEVENWIQANRVAFPSYKSADEVGAARKQKSKDRFSGMVNEASRERLASIGDFKLVDDGRFTLSVVYEKLPQLENDWAPMSLHVVVDRNVKRIEFADSDKARVLDALQRFSSELARLRHMALDYAREMNVELWKKDKWIAATEMTDQQLLRTVKKLSIRVWHPRPEYENAIATLELTCDWDPEHGVRFGLLDNGQIEIGID